ncbi:unnamed protein product [Meloidogyne enterolobii]
MIKKLRDPKYLCVMKEESWEEMLAELTEKLEENEDVEEVTNVILTSIDKWGKGIHQVNKKLVSKDKEEIKKPVANDNVEANKTKEGKKLEPIFTANPAELKGEIINVRLNKAELSGIFYNGMDGTRARDEFIQVENVVPDFKDFLPGFPTRRYSFGGIVPHISGFIPGDIIVYVNRECMLGATLKNYLKRVNSFSDSAIINFQLCRGYAMQKKKIQLIRGKDYSGYFSFITGGSPAWCYLLFDEDKKEVLLEKVKPGTMDIKEFKEYGEVLYSGLGKDPPQDIIDKLIEEYGIKHVYTLSQTIENLFDPIISITLQKIRVVFSETLKNFGMSGNASVTIGQ